MNTNLRQTYQSFVRSQPDVPIFLNGEWFDAVCTDWDYLTVKRGNELVGVWPYQNFQILKWCVARAMPLTPFSGPIISQRFRQDDKGILEEMLHRINSSRFLYFNQILAPYFHGDDFASKKLKCIREAKQIIRLGNEREIFMKINSRKQRYIKKHYRHEAIEESSETSDLSSFNLHSFQKRKTGRPFNAATLDDILGIGGSKSKLFYYRVDEVRLAGALILFYGARCSLLCTGRNPQLSGPGPLEALIWHCIKYAISNGSNVFDFNGSNDPGIAKFNHSFGAEDEFYTRLTKSTAAHRIAKSLSRTSRP